MLSIFQWFHIKSVFQRSEFYVICHQTYLALHSINLKIVQHLHKCHMLFPRSKLYVLLEVRLKFLLTEIIANLSFVVKAVQNRRKEPLIEKVWQPLDK